MSNAIVRYFEQRSTISSEGTPRDPSEYLRTVFGGKPVASGIRVNEDSALSWTALWAGVRFLSETMAGLPLDVIRVIGPRKKQTLDDHAIARLHRDGPNEEQTWFEWMQMMQAQQEMFGVGYSQIIWDGRNDVAELWPTHFDRVTPERDRSGKLVYRLSIPTELRTILGNDKIVEAEDMLVLPGFSPGGLFGERIAQRFRETIGVGLATELYIAHFYGQGANASGFLSHPGRLGDKAFNRLKKSIDDQLGGIDKAHRYLILEEAMQWHQLSVDPDKAQALGLRKFQLGEAARILGVPPFVVGDLERATFSNTEQQNRQVVVYALTSRVVRFEQRLRKQLISDKMRARDYVKLNLSSLLRGDTAAQTQSFTAGRNGGWFSVNDIRDILDLNAVADGDEYLKPSTMIPLGTAPPPPTNPTPSGEADGEDQPED